MNKDSVDILGFPVSRKGLDAALRWVGMAIAERKPRHVVTANAEILYNGWHDKSFGALLTSADLITADGSGVVWASRFLGTPLTERVTGIDLISRIFAAAEEEGWGIYFLGARPEIVEKAVLNTLGRFPRLKVSGYHHGYFSQQETAAVVSNIHSVQPEILLVAMGSPRQERFIQENLHQLSVPVSIGVGGSLDVLSGTVDRAPVWMQKNSLEWLYRLLKSPSRLGRMLALPLFVLAVIRQRFYPHGQSI